MQSNNDKELKLVHIVYRHGIRTPADTYPNDPHINNPLFPTGWGQITNKGKENLFDHGRYLRQRYNNFLGSYYSPYLYYVQSTDVDRAKVSAQCINAGLWPPCNLQRWGSIDWQPIPVHYEPLNTDSLLLVRKPCPQYHLELDRLVNTEEIQSKLRDSQKLFEGISKHTGKKIETFEDVQDVYTTLMSEEAFGLELPPWCGDFYPNAMSSATIFSYVLNAYNDKLNRFKGGVFVKKLIEDWSKLRKGVLKCKAYLYVGHDSTIVNILSALKLWEPQVPNFSANIFFELWYDRTRDEYGVEIFFRNVVDAFAEPVRLKMPGCDYFCPVDEFVQLTKSVVPDNWEEECKSDQVGYKPPAPKGP
ncbi:hypothetical protein RN001_011239 [Aquatica leii]|uniref:Acid phosphatase n=1 Tax=Aquatica leii TaxID=1421715 RepID=A0AAN7QI04_9COLE|nr:hypothetical protein RN001_011239 [Aquatica leii]